MKGAGTVVNVRNRASFKGSDDGKGLERARFDDKAQKTRKKLQHTWRGWARHCLIVTSKTSIAAV